MKNDSQAAIARWVGQEHLNCWQLVRDAYALAGVELPDDPYAATRLFVTLEENEQIEYGDVVAIAHGRNPLVPNHVGFVLDARSGVFIHSLEGTGVVLSFVYRRPWAERIVGFMRLRR